MQPHEFIKKIRLEKGMKQEAVANAIYVHKSTYSLYESGNRGMDAQTYQNILSALGVIEAHIVLNEENDSLFQRIFINLQEALKDYPQIDSFLLTKMATRFEDEIEEYSLDEEVIENLTPYFRQGKRNKEMFHVGFLLGENDHPIGFNQDGDEVGYGQWILTYLNQPDDEETEEYKKFRKEVVQAIIHEMHNENIIDSRVKGMAQSFLPFDKPQTNETKEELKQRLIKKTIHQIRKTWREHLATERICYAVFKNEIDLGIILKHGGTVLCEGYLKKKKGQDFIPVVKMSILNLYADELYLEESIEELDAIYCDITNRRLGREFIDKKSFNQRTNISE